MAKNPLNGNGRGPQDPVPFVRRKEIAARTTLSIALLHELIKKGQFPPYVKLGPRVAGLPEDILDAWLESRMDARSSMRALCDSVKLPRWTPCRPSGRSPAGIRIVERSEVLDRLGIAPKTLYAWVRTAQPSFPAPVPVTERRRGWAAHEVDAWLREREARVLAVRRESIGDLVRRHLEGGLSEPVAPSGRRFE